MMTDALTDTMTVPVRLLRRTTVLLTHTLTNGLVRLLIALLY
jgi:hypothetical protein